MCTYRCQIVKECGIKSDRCGVKAMKKMWLVWDKREYFRKLKPGETPEKVYATLKCMLPSKCTSSNLSHWSEIDAAQIEEEAAAEKGSWPATEEGR